MWGAFMLALVFASGNAYASRNFQLGMSAAFTGPSGGLGVELFRGSVAYFTFLNQQGGINGKPIVILPRDDGYQPDPAIQNTIELTQRPDVQCLFGYVGTPTVTRILPLLKGYGGDQKILFFPFTGAESQRQGPYSKYVFNLRASYRQELSELVNKLVGLGRKRIAVFYQADAYGRSGWDGVRRALSFRNLTMVGEATYRRGTGFGQSMDEQVRILAQAKPDVIISIGAYAACAGFIRDARNTGLNVPIANVSFVGSENLLILLERAEKELGKQYTHDLINTQVVPSYEDLSLPAVREYRHLMETIPVPPPFEADKAYHSLRYSFTGFEGFLNAKLMTAVLRKMEESSSGDLMEAAESLHDYDIGIGTSVGFSSDNHQALKRVYFTTVQDGRFVPLSEEQWELWRK